MVVAVAGEKAALLVVIVPVVMGVVVVFLPLQQGDALGAVNLGVPATVSRASSMASSRPAPLRRMTSARSRAFIS